MFKRDVILESMSEEGLPEKGTFESSPKSTKYLLLHQKSPQTQQLEGTAFMMSHSSREPRIQEGLVPAQALLLGHSQGLSWGCVI